jgi:hypothetical protein
MDVVLPSAGARVSFLVFSFKTLSRQIQNEAGVCLIVVPCRYHSTVEVKGVQDINASLGLLAD